MKDFILKRLPKKYLPKSKKSKSPRAQVCKVNKEGKMVYLLYTKSTNTEDISEKENKGYRTLLKHDYAGVFETYNDAEAVADCLEKIFKHHHIYNDQYVLDSYYVHKLNDYHYVMGLYKMIGAVKRGKYVDENLLAIVTNKDDLPRVKQSLLDRLIDHSHWSTKIQRDPQIHVMRYKLNDVMPTMNLEDYHVEAHKENLKTIVKELYKYPHNQHTKSVISELEYMPPSKALKTGGVHYQNLVNDPEFQERWK